MAESALRWTFSLLALFLVGPLLAILIHGLRAVDGSNHVSLLVGAAPMKGLLLGVAILFAAGVFGVVTGKLVTKGTALAAAGLVMVWSAWQLGTIDELVRTSPTSPMMALAAEGLITGLLGVFIAGAIEVFAKSGGHSPRHVFAEPFKDASHFASIFAGVLVGGVVVWFVGYQMLKGQALFAAFIGAIGAGAAAQLTAMMMGKEPRPTSGYFAIAILAGAAPMIAMWYHGEGLQAAVRSGPGGFFGAAVPVSLDWVVGMLLGVPVGQGWAASMIEKRMQAA